MIDVRVRFCAEAAPTFDAARPFQRVPNRGESILHDDNRYVVVDIDWCEDGTAFVVAHGFSRRRAQAILHGIPA